MTLPKKKSRQIDVGGHKYRWTVSQYGDEEEPEAGFMTKLTVGNSATGVIKWTSFDGLIPIKPSIVRNFIISNFDEFK